MQRAELRVLLDRADAGLDAAARVRERLAALAGLQQCQLVEVRAQRPRARLEYRGALAGSCARPRYERGACGAHGGRRRVGGARGDRVERLSRGRVPHLDPVRCGRCLKRGHRVSPYPQEKHSSARPILTMTRLEAPEMTSDRTQAYGRVVKTLDDLGPTKLQPAELDRVREAADTLIFASGIDETREAMADIDSLAEHLVASD